MTKDKKHEILKLHYQGIPSGQFKQVPRKPIIKRFKLPLRTKKLTRKFGNWFYSLVFSLLPSLIIFFIFTEPSEDFSMLALFNDKAIIYVCVTMSALTLYICGKFNIISYFLVIVMTIGTTVYISTTLGIEPSVYIKYKQEEVCAWFFLFSILLGLLTIIYSSRRSEKGVKK
jgi:hypothetical protein